VRQLIVSIRENQAFFISLYGTAVGQTPFSRSQAISHLCGVPIVHAAYVGTVAGLVIAGLVISNVSTLWIAASVCFVVGVITNVPGALLIKTYNWIRGKLIG
jgi:hypothetical protein